MCVGDNTNIGLGVRPLPENFIAFWKFYSNLPCEKGNIFVRYAPRPKSRGDKIKVPNSNE